MSVGARRDYHVSDTSLPEHTIGIYQYAGHSMAEVSRAYEAASVL